MSSNLQNINQMPGSGSAKPKLVIAAPQEPEQLLQLSAQELAGAKHQGRAGGDIGWHGMQHGRIVLAERKLRVARPRLRRKDGAGEVEIPAYRRLHDDARLGGRVRDIVIAGVSTRQYRKVLPQVADSVGIAKSSVSRRFIEASAAQLATLHKRRFDEVDLLAIYIDGIVVAGRHVLVAIGVDATGTKHLLGLAALKAVRVLPGRSIVSLSSPSLSPARVKAT